MTRTPLIGFGPPPTDPALLGRDALDRGQQALATGDFRAATKWFDRGRRILPRDPLMKLMLAIACAAHDPERAEALFSELAGQYDSPEITSGLALTRLKLNRQQSRDEADPEPRLEGMVEARDGMLAGWAWYPARPDQDPVLTIEPHGQGPLTVIAREPAEPPPGSLLGRSRRFLIPASGLRAPVHVRDRRGHDLLGSPLDPSRQAETRPCRLGTRSKPPGRIPRRRNVVVVIPVHDGGETTLSCLRSVLAHGGYDVAPMVVDDGSTDPDLRVVLDGLAARREIRLVRHKTARGFPGAANAGLRACAGFDVILLNSDTLVAPSWVARLHGPAYSGRAIGTVTPLSNSATILSYPGAAADNPIPDQAETVRLSRLAYRANRGSAVKIPVAVGFCMLLRHDFIAAVGRFRTDLFAQGYGEENDLCLRGSRLGWRHVAATGVFVAHHGGRSFGPGGLALARRNQAILNRVHPGHDSLIGQWMAADKLAGARRRLDLARWRDGRRRESVIIVSHDDGGGVAVRVAQSCAAHRDAGRHPIVLRPAPDGPVSLGADYPNLRFALPKDRARLLRLLQAEAPSLIEFHHLLNHHPSLPELLSSLRVPYDVHVHDHGWVCPRLMLINKDGRYCGEPDLAECERCVTEAGSALDHISSVAEFRHWSLAFLTAARRVLAPSEDAARRLRRYFPDLRPEVVPHDTERRGAPPGATDGFVRVCIVGAISVPKGFDVVLACARDAATRRLPLEFVIAGSSIDDLALLETGRVFVTGTFPREEAVAVIREQRSHLAWLPSVWPETWCYALSDAWAAGLTVAAFDIGAQAERIRGGGGGVLLPLGMPPAKINEALLAAAAQRVHEEPMSLTRNRHS